MGRLLISFGCWLLGGAATGATQDTAEYVSARRVSLNGSWQICQANDEHLPREEAYGATVPVPGLVTLARPAFPEVGKKESLKAGLSYWCKRRFTWSEDMPPCVRLKIHKVAYGCSVYLNGTHIGDGPRSFTPQEFDVDGVLKAGDNEIVIRIGAHETHPLTKGYPSGHDKEKKRCEPGLFDSVELIASGLLRLENIQIAPQIETGQIVVKAAITNLGDEDDNYWLEGVVHERESGREIERKVLGYDQKPHIRNVVRAGETVYVYNTLNIADFKLWSPESPVLYELEVNCRSLSDDASRSDRKVETFGMRSFSFDPKTGIPMLNGKPRYLRGTNICIYRFFEDPEMGNKPWDEAWVRKLIRSFRDMGWNACRYCIGFPPEMWYRIADEEGLLVMDEYPMWGVSRWIHEDVELEKIVEAYRAWMHERWNHASVIAWDAQNETWGRGIIAEAVARVRGEDMSDRPWDIGWDTLPWEQGPDNHRLRRSDSTEFHHYFYMKAGWHNEVPGTAADMEAAFRDLKARWSNKAVIINEYGWLWLNRDSSPTKLSEKIYNRFFKEGGTENQRREFYARQLAMMTELYRADRDLAGVLHFCSLSFNHMEEAYTCDHFIDLENQIWDPYFLKYVKDAFSPLGLMIDWWQESVVGGEEITVPLNIINDTDQVWSGTVQLALRDCDGKELQTVASETITVQPLTGRQRTSLSLAIPREDGIYEMHASIRHGERVVNSYRLIRVGDGRALILQ